MSRDSNAEYVVVGVDGSPPAAMALAWAARYAKAIGASLRVVMAGEFEPARQQDLDQAIAATLGDERALAVEHKIAEGHPADVLIHESQSADLLVVGHRGHGGMTNLLAGSVSLECVNHSACPVTVIRHEGRR